MRLAASAAVMALPTTLVGRSQPWGALGIGGGDGLRHFRQRISQ
jgi:hypothetical protein